MAAAYTPSSSRPGKGTLKLHDLRAAFTFSSLLFFSLFLSLVNLFIPFIRENEFSGMFNLSIAKLNH